MTKANLESAWREYLSADTNLIRAKLRLGSHIEPRTSLILASLGCVAERGATLRWLMATTEFIDRDLSRALLGLAAVGHSDIQLVRDVMMKYRDQIPEEWLAQDVAALLADGDEEEYRRLAELFRVMSRTLVRLILTVAAQSSDLNIRQVAVDFSEM